MTGPRADRRLTWAPDPCPPAPRGGLWVGGWDWSYFPDVTTDDWAELEERLGVADRYTFLVELVDEGRARLHTSRKTTIRARRPAVDPVWSETGVQHHDWGVICTAVYVDIRKLPRWLLERMHP
jgi:hypothetical protein